MNEHGPTPEPASVRVTHVMRTASTSVERRAHLAAARYLMRHCDERVIVVVDDPESQEPIGVITEDDVDRALALGHDLNDVRVADILPKAPHATAAGGFGTSVTSQPTTRRRLPK